MDSLTDHDVNVNAGSEPPISSPRSFSKASWKEFFLLRLKTRSPQLMWSAKMMFGGFIFASHNHLFWYSKLKRTSSDPPTLCRESRWAELRRGKGAACLGVVALALRRRVPPLISLLLVDSAFPFGLAQDRLRTMMLEKVSQSVARPYPKSY